MLLIPHKLRRRAGARRARLSSEPAHAPARAPADGAAAADGATADAAESRLFPAPKDLRRVGTWVHLDDLTDAVLEACSDAEASPDPALVEPSSVRTIEAAKARPARSNYYL